MSTLLLFAQHGWADTNREMLKLARTLALPDAQIVAPNLGYLRTWLIIGPLIELVESSACDMIARYPSARMRIIGHSMGGLIWLEVLHRHREWWSRIDNLVLLASPVGGADLGRLIDPLALVPGIARDLGRNRRALAEAVAAEIPTLAIAGDVDGGSDRTVTLDAARFRHAHFVRLPGVSHPDLRCHPRVIAIIRHFWAGTLFAGDSSTTLSDKLIQQLQAVPGMTDGHRRDLRWARPAIQFANGLMICTWKNLAGVDHVFVMSNEGACLYAGFVGWLHAAELRRALEYIRQEYAEWLL